MADDKIAGVDTDEEPDDAEDEKKKKEAGVKVYARIRKRFPQWEDEIALDFTKKTIRNRGKGQAGRVTTRYFHQVFGPTADNFKCFKEMVVPMLDNVVAGFPSVLIAYGQTGAGKTYTMLGIGTKDPGLLPQALEWLIQKSDDKKVLLKGVETYGLKINKLSYFDLMDPKNQTPKWSDKTPLRALNLARGVEVSNLEECVNTIRKSHSASHFAPTAKNPQSSRGHIAFITEVIVERRKSTFIVVDLAGSEGMDAIESAALRRNPVQFELRKLEAGTIKHGLGEIKNMMNELKRKKLEARQGTGIRRVLHQYVTGNSMLAFLFAIAPSKQHSIATENTLRVSDSASTIKKQVGRAKRQKKSPLEKLMKLKALFAVKMKENDDLREQVATAEEQAAQRFQEDLNLKTLEVEGLEKSLAMSKKTMERLKADTESVVQITRDQALKDGKKQGYKEGYDEGCEEGREDARKEFEARPPVREAPEQKAADGLDTGKAQTVPVTAADAPPAKVEIKEKIVYKEKIVTKEVEVKPQMQPGRPCPVCGLNFNKIVGDMIAATESDLMYQEQHKRDVARIKHQQKRNRWLQHDFQKKLNRKNEQIESLADSITELTQQIADLQERVPEDDKEKWGEDKDKWGEGDEPEGAPVFDQAKSKMFDATDGAGVGIEDAVAKALAAQEDDQRNFLRLAHDTWDDFRNDFGDYVNDQIEKMGYNVSAKDKKKLAKKKKEAEKEKEKAEKAKQQANKKKGKERKRKKVERSLSTVENVNIMFGGLKLDDNGRIGLPQFTEGVKEIWNLDWNDSEIKMCFQRLDDKKQGAIDPQYLKDLCLIETRDREWDTIDTTMRRTLQRILASSVLDKAADFCCDWLHFKKGIRGKMALVWVEINVDKGKIIVFKSNVDRQSLKEIELKGATFDLPDNDPCQFTVKTFKGKKTVFRAERSLDRDIWIALVKRASGAAQELGTMKKLEDLDDEKTK